MESVLLDEGGANCMIASNRISSTFRSTVCRTLATSSVRHARMEASSASIWPRMSPGPGTGSGSAAGAIGFCSAVVVSSEQASSAHAASSSGTGGPDPASTC